MILPVVAYGDSVLRKKTRQIEADHKGLTQLIDDMFETMYNARGIGLAAPQIGKSISLFIIDTNALLEENNEGKGLRKVFINAEKIDEFGNKWSYEEGCLSIPHIREEVLRKKKIKLRYFDEEFKEHEEEFTKINARVIQHEYDHIEGKLFTDLLKPLKKRLLKSKLTAISKGKVNVEYRMKFPK